MLGESLQRATFPCAGEAYELRGALSNDALLAVMI